MTLGKCLPFSEPSFPRLCTEECDPTVSKALAFSGRRRQNHCYPTMLSTHTSFLHTWDRQEGNWHPFICECTRSINRYQVPTVCPFRSETHNVLPSRSRVYGKGGIWKPIIMAEQDRSVCSHCGILLCVMRYIGGFDIRSCFPAYLLGTEAEGRWVTYSR